MLNAKTRLLATSSSTEAAQKRFVFKDNNPFTKPGSEQKALQFAKTFVKTRADLIERLRNV